MKIPQIIIGKYKINIEYIKPKKILYTSSMLAFAFHSNIPIKIKNIKLNMPNMMVKN